MRFSREKIAAVYKRGKKQCHLCHGKLDLSRYGEQWQCDHLTPVSKGGTNALENLLPAHALCNQRRGARTVAWAKKHVGKPRRKQRRIKKLKRLTKMAVTTMLLAAGIDLPS